MGDNPKNSLFSFTITSSDDMKRMYRTGELHGRKKAKKVKTIKLYLYIIWWLFKNRHWEDCRQKWKALDKEITKRGF